MKAQNKRNVLKQILRVVFIFTFCGIVNIGVFFWYLFLGWPLIVSLMVSGGIAGLVGVSIMSFIIKLEAKKK